MALDKQVIIGKIEVLPDEQLQVREDTIITDDGQEISRTYRRYVLTPGADVSSQPERIQTIANTLWTSDVVAAFNTTLIHT